MRGLVFRLAVPEGVRGDCPGCGERLRPVPPYRCPHCRARLGLPPLLLEAVLAVVLAGLAGRSSGWGFAAAAALFALCVPLAVIDLTVHRLPDVLTLPAYALTLALLAPAGPHDWLRALYGGLALAGCYLLLHLISPSGMGPGDVKLALSLGTLLAWHGWPTLLQGGFLAFLLAALYSVPLLLLRRREFAFGPFMIAGAWLGLLLA
jgi:leader peptidase (prepilin peptidase)/N-methyltransferase